MKEISMELVCELSDAEVMQRSQELSFAVVQYDEIELEKKNVADDYKGRLKEVGGKIRKLSSVVRRREETRVVLCAIEFHKPNQGMKRIVRLDTGEVVKEESMTSSECQQNMFDDRPAEQSALPAESQPVEVAQVSERTAHAYGGEPLPAE